MITPIWPCALRERGEDGLREAIISAIARKPKGHDFVINRREAKAVMAYECDRRIRGQQMTEVRMIYGSAALFGLAGWSGSGKTTLAEQLITELTAQGLKMATIKHAHGEFDADTPGKDSWRYRCRGGLRLVSSAIRFAHFVEHLS